jgi:hypothetical protein
MCDLLRSPVASGLRQRVLIPFVGPFRQSSSTHHQGNSTAWRLPLPATQKACGVAVSNRQITVSNQPSSPPYDRGPTLEGQKVLLKFTVQNNLLS